MVPDEHLIAESSSGSKYTKHILYNLKKEAPNVLAVTTDKKTINDITVSKAAHLMWTVILSLNVEVLRDDGV